MVPLLFRYNHERRARLPAQPLDARRHVLKFLGFGRLINDIVVVGVVVITFKGASTLSILELRFIYFVS